MNIENETNGTEVENTKQITTGKGRLRHRIKELEAALVTIQSQPLRRKFEALEREHAALRERCNAIEALALKSIDTMLELVKLMENP